MRRRGSRPFQRGHRDRQAVERTQTLKKEREQAASLLQTRQRGRIACREVDERREQSQAATSIGKIYRGKQRGGPGSIGGPGRVTETMCRMVSIR